MKFYLEHIENNIRLDQQIDLGIRPEQECPAGDQFLKIYT